MTHKTVIKVADGRRVECGTAKLDLELRVKTCKGPLCVTWNFVVMSDDHHDTVILDTELLRALHLLDSETLVFPTEGDDSDNDDDGDDIDHSPIFTTGLNVESDANNNRSDVKSDDQITVIEPVTKVRVAKNEIKSEVFAELTGMKEVFDPMLHPKGIDCPPMMIKVVPDAAMPYDKPRPVPQAMVPGVRDTIEQWKSQGVVEDGNIGAGNVASPIVIVKKKTACADNRTANGSQC